MVTLLRSRDQADTWSTRKNDIGLGEIDQALNITRWRSCKQRSIHYIFYKDKFFAVRIHTDGAKEFEAFRDAIFKEYGEGQHPERVGNLERWIWYGKITDMVLEYNLSNKETIFHMWSVKMEEEILKE